MEFELIGQRICMSKDIGVHNNLFGGIMLSMIDETAAAYVSTICRTPRIVTLKINDVLFKKPVKVGNIILIYGRVIKIGTTSITIEIDVRKRTVQTGKEESVCSTSMVFVKIDDEGNPVPICKTVRDIYKKIFSGENNEAKN